MFAQQSTASFSPTLQNPVPWPCARAAFFVRALSILALVLLALCPNAFAQSSHHTFHVSLQVGGEPALAPQIEIYLSGALQALGDVELTDKDPDFGLEVAGAFSERSDMIALSVITSRRHDNAPLGEGIRSFLLEKTLPPLHTKSLGQPLYSALADSLARQTSGSLTSINHRIRLFERYALHDQCNQIVADFNREVLLPERMKAAQQDELPTSSPLAASHPAHKP